MSLLTPAAPSACLAAFLNELSAYLPGGPSGTVVVESYVGKVPNIPHVADLSTASGVPNVSAMLQVFVLSLTDAANNTGSISPASAGWRLFAGDLQNKTVVGRLVQLRQGWKLVAVQYGELVWEALNASHQLHSTPPPQVQMEDYELRLLSIPGLNLEVYWLAAQKTGSADYIFPTPTAVSPPIFLGGPSAPLELPHFLAEIRPLAASLLTMPAGYGS